MRLYVFRAAEGLYLNCVRINEPYIQDMYMDYKRFCCCFRRIAGTLNTNCNNIITTCGFYCSRFPHGIQYLIGPSRYVVEACLRLLYPQSTACASDSLFSVGNLIFCISKSAVVQSRYYSLTTYVSNDVTELCTGQGAFGDNFSFCLTNMSVYIYISKVKVSRYKPGKALGVPGG